MDVVEGIFQVLLVMLNILGLDRLRFTISVTNQEIKNNLIATTKS